MLTYFFDAPSSPSATIDKQRTFLNDVPADSMRLELEAIWKSEPLPRAALDLIKEGQGGVHRLADTLSGYWSVAIEPHWRGIRAVLDDIAFRAAELTNGGLSAMFAVLHPKVSIDKESMRIDLRHSFQDDLAGAGLILMPSVFVWPNIAFSLSPDRPRLTYAAPRWGEHLGHDWSRPVRRGCPRRATRPQSRRNPDVFGGFTFDQRTRDETRSEQAGDQPASCGSPTERPGHLIARRPPADLSAYAPRH